MTTIEEQLKKFVDNMFDIEGCPNCAGCKKGAVTYVFPEIKIDDITYNTLYRFIRTSHTNNLIKIHLEIEIVTMYDYIMRLPEINLVLLRDLETLEIENITAILKETKNILSNMKFDKLTSSLIHTDYAKEKLIIDAGMLDFLITDGNGIEPAYGECCICKDLTHSKTTCCRGELCIPCLLRIRPTTSDLEDPISCPLCRCDLTR
jgi:hypothetical protein